MLRPFLPALSDTELARMRAAKALNVKHEKVAGLDKQGKQFAIAGGVDPITMTTAYIELYTYPYRYPK